MSRMLTTPRIVVRRLASLLALGLVLGVSTVGFAQEEAAPEGGESDAASSESAPAEEPDASEAEGDLESEGLEEPDGPDPDDPNYWSKVRKVHTVQKREFQKVQRFSATLYGGVIPNNIFERYFPVGLRLNYFILENIGFELAGSRSFRAKTSLEDVLNETQGVNAESVRVADSQVWHTNFGIVWSPFYGKASWYENAIGYFDLNLFGGMGMVFTRSESEDDRGLPYNELPMTIKPEGVLGGGLAWYFSDHVSVRADYRQFIFQKVSGVGGVANPSEVSLGFGWFF